MEDCLGEALHVLRSHAVGSGLGADMHTLLSVAGGAAGLSSLSQSFSLHGRVPGLVPNHHEESASLLHGQDSTSQPPTSSQSESFSSKSHVQGSFSFGKSEAGNQKASMIFNLYTHAYGVSFINILIKVCFKTK